jgi:two-component system response regulator
VNDRPVLLIEDDLDDIELTKRAFARSPFANDVEVARDGTAALERLLGPDAGPMPALVLLDLKLPRVNGLEVLQRLRADERTRFLPIVILTSSGEERDLMEGYRLGANSYLRKPVDFGAFQSTIDQIGAYWLVLNQTPVLR